MHQDQRNQIEVKWVTVLAAPGYSVQMNVFDNAATAKGVMANPKYQHNHKAIFRVCREATGNVSVFTNPEDWDAPAVKVGQVLLEAHAHAGTGTDWIFQSFTECGQETART